VICIHGYRNVAVYSKVTSVVVRCLVGSKATMNPLLHALSLLILLRCGAVKLPPICDQWSPLTLSEIWDTHLVLCLSIEGDVAAAWTLHAIRLCYDWTSLGRSLPVLKEMWFRFVKKNIPLPRPVLEAGDTIHKRLKGFTLANFPDESCLCRGLFNVKRLYVNYMLQLISRWPPTRRLLELRMVCLFLPFRF
jgi:hypothetical protein